MRSPVVFTIDDGEDTKRNANPNANLSKGNKKGGGGGRKSLPLVWGTIDE